MDIVKVKFMYHENTITIRIHFPDLSEENCLSWIPPFQILDKTINIQEKMIKSVAEASLDIISHNQISQQKFAEISMKIEKYPALIKNMYDDLSAIHKSVHRMKKKLRLPIYRPPEDE